MYTYAIMVTPSPPLQPPIRLAGRRAWPPRWDSVGALAANPTDRPAGQPAVPATTPVFVISSRATLEPRGTALAPFRRSSLRTVRPGRFRCTRVVRPFYQYNNTIVITTIFFFSPGSSVLPNIK